MLDTSPRVWLFALTRLVTNGAFRFLYPFLPVVAASLGLSESGSGILVATLALGGIAAPATRHLLTGGRERPRRLAVVGMLVMAAGATTAAGAPGLAVGLLGFLVLGAGKPLVDVAAITYVSDRVELARRARATSIMELTWAGGLVIVAPIAGIIAARSSWQVPMGGLAALAALLGVALAVRLDPDPPDPREAIDDDEVIEVVRDGAVRPFLAMAGLLYVTLEATFAVSGLWAARTFGASIQELGGFVAAAAMGELLGSLAVTLFADRWGKARMLTGGLVACAAGLATLPFAPSLMWAAAGLSLALFGSEVAIVSSIPLASEVTPHARSQFLAGVVSVGSMSRVVAALIGPVLLVGIGIGANVLVSIVAAGGAVWTLRRILAAHPRLRA